MKKLVYMISAVMLIIAGCDNIKIPGDAITDYPIIIGGTWKIGKVLQNNVDITSSYDFSSFLLTLNYTGETPSTFAISDNKTPFASINPPVNNFTQGTWEFDNPIYPSEIHLKSASSAIIKIQPVFAKNNTHLDIEFQMDCSNNKYVYQLIKN